MEDDSPNHDQSDTGKTGPELPAARTVSHATRVGRVIRFVPQASFSEIKLCWPTALKPNITNQTEFLKNK